MQPLIKHRHFLACPFIDDHNAEKPVNLTVPYLVFNAGFSAEATGAGLSREAIRLGRLLLDLLPEPEVMGLLGLMLLQESRRVARSSAEGDVPVLALTTRLMSNPARRVVETAQMVVDVMQPGELTSDEGRGRRTLQKVRLMHAAVRQLAHVLRIGNRSMGRQ